MKLLILTSRFPYPIEKGDKLRAFYQIKGLAENHQLVLVSLCEQQPSDSDLSALRPYCQEIHCLPLSRWGLPVRLLRGWLQGLPLQVSWFYRPALQPVISRIIREENPDLIFCQLLRPAQYLKGISGPKAIDYMDCFSLGINRRAKRASFFTKPVWKMESQRLAAYEAQIFAWFDYHAIISAQDRDQLPITESQRVRVVPNGVDTQFFQPAKDSLGKEVIFVGNMGYAPNIEAAHILTEEVMPLVWKQNPGIKLVLAGARPAASIRSLARPGKVEVTGWLPDIRSAYQRGMIMAAPLQSGSGQQNKILEAMAMGVPCITTTLVNNAIGAKPGDSILIADDPETMADQILELAEDRSRQKKLRLQGRDFVVKTYSWEAAVEKLERSWESSATD